MAILINCLRVSQSFALNEIIYIYMLKKQNIILLGGRKGNDPGQTKTSLSKLGRNISSSTTKSGFFDTKSDMADKRYQVRMDPTKPSILRQRNLNTADGNAGNFAMVRPDPSVLRDREKQKEESRPQSIIERIEQQKKEFLERERQRELERERYMQQLQKERKGQYDKAKDVQAVTQNESFKPKEAKQSKEPKEPENSSFKKQDQVLKEPDPLKKYKASTSLGLVGLSNIGNTCFMNATLQCLFNIPDFNEYFITGEYRREIKNAGNIAEQYAKLITLIRTTPNRSETPSQLKYALAMRNSQFKGFAQQDAQELLVTVLECIGEDLSRVDKKSAPYRELTADIKTKTVQKISQQWWDYNKLRDDSIVIDFFSGQVMSTVICTRCKNQSIAFDNFRDMSLSFPKNSDSNLSNMIDNFFKEESLVDDYFCSSCKKPRESKRRLSLMRLPRVLIIQLKRFSYGKWKKDKINQEIQFTEKIDLSKYMQQGMNETAKPYELIGMVNHSGGIDFGHYTADCRNPINGKWYHFNDSSVKESMYGNQSRYGSQLPYLLFYYRSD